MAKTRSKKPSPQTKNNNNNNSARLTRSMNNTTDGRVNKNTRATRRTICARAPTPVPEIKDNNKSTNAKLKERWVTDEKIKKLIDYVENEKMTIKDAAIKVNMGTTASYKYYGIYRDDPEHKIPTLGYDSRRAKNYFSYDQVKALISFIVDDKLSISDAAAKANMHKKTALNYYTKYMMDPEHKIPLHGTTKSRDSNIMYTQDQIKELINYVDNDNLTVREASKRVNMGETTAYRYYNRYKSDPEKKIPIPGQSPVEPKTTSNQVEMLIGYIVENRMSVKKAAIKANMRYTSANKYYVKYLRDPKHEIPIPGRPTYDIRRRCTPEDIKKLIEYMDSNKMNGADAARKIGVAPETARRYYRKYLNDPNRQIPLSKKPTAGHLLHCTYDQVKNLINHIVNDNMSIRKAAMMVDIDRNTASQYYRRYVEDPNHAIPTPEKRDRAVPTPDQIKQFLGYIIEDNMTIIEAGRQAGLRKHQAYIFSTMYKENPLGVYSKPNVDEQVKLLVKYVSEDKMTIKAASEKLKLSYSMGIKLYNECKENLENRPRTFLDVYYANLKAVAEVYEKYQKME